MPFCCCSVFPVLFLFLLVATVHSLLGVVKYSIEFSLQLTYNLGTLQFSLIYSFLPVGFLQSSAPYVMWALMLPECFSYFMIISSEWEQMIWGAGSGRDLFGGGGGREEFMCPSFILCVPWPKLSLFVPAWVDPLLLFDWHHLHCSWPLRKTAC